MNNLIMLRGFECYQFTALNWMPLTGDSPDIFGFSDFLAGLALMVLAWTLGDKKYRFRVSVAPIPLYSVTFYAVGLVGVLVLLTELWIHENWPVITGQIISTAEWQAALGFILLVTFFTWVYFSFIRPPKFGKNNAKRYLQHAYTIITKSDPSELVMFADELNRSCDSIISFANVHDRFQKAEKADKKAKATVSEYADELLLLIADRRFCRTLVGSSSVTIFHLFDAIRKREKYRVGIGLFARNITTESISNTESFLYHEAEGYYSGLLGYTKPVTSVLYSNYKLVEEVEQMLDVDYESLRQWRHINLAAYGRIIKMACTDIIRDGNWWHSFPIYRAIENLGRVSHQLPALNKIQGTYENDTYRQLDVVTDFFRDTMDSTIGLTLDRYFHRTKRVRTERRGYRNTNLLDTFAKLIYDLIEGASRVYEPFDTCWWVQHNALWSEIFLLSRDDSEVYRIILFKIRRLIYNQIKEMDNWPDFRGGSLLGMCLNVMQFEPKREPFNRETYPLHAAIVKWTKANFSRLHKKNPAVLVNCLPNRLSYDEIKNRLVYTYPPNAFKVEPTIKYLELDPAE